jgi:hypothetical protein
MRMLQAALPNALFIGLVRNPYAVCEGIRRRRQHELDTCARQWRDANRTMLEDAEHLRHFLLVRYEDLVSAPAQTLATICAFVGISPVTLSPNEIFERQNITNAPQPIRNFNQMSFDKLNAAEIKTITDVCWPFAERFGYEPK